MRLAAVDRIAHRLGLAPGMTLADARAIVPDLVVHDHDARADARWLDRLVEGCARYTPMAKAVPPDGLILDITGCAHLFGGEAALRDDAAMRLDRLGMAQRIAMAATAEAALALARYGRAKDGADESQAIRALPVAALGLPPESTLGLRRAGLKNIGAVADRSRASIAARFGAVAVSALARLLGEERGPLAPHIATPPVHIDRRFPEPIARTEYALSMLDEMAAEAGERLAERGSGARRFVATFFRSDGLAQQLGVELGRPVRDAAAVMRLFRERIDRLDDPLDPGFGYDAMRLSVGGEQALRDTQPGLEREAAAESELAALIDRLSIRFGRDRLRRCLPRDTHIPEARQHCVAAFEDGGKATVWPAPEPGEPPLRPMQLFDPPERVTVIAEVPDGPPWRFVWRGTPHDIARFEGPERIAALWWTRPRDPLGERRRTRDYYRVEDVAGRRYWLFRHGLYGREAAMPGWYLHGLFA